MPRAGWLALGAIGGALLASAGHSPLAGIASGALAGCLAAGGAIAWARHRQAALWLAVGIALLVGRIALGLGVALLLGPPRATTDAVPANPSSGTVHLATVVTTYAPGNGQQRAVLELEPSGAGRAWATLPRYPTLAATDRVRIDGRLEPAPVASDSGFGEFLARGGIGWTVRARSLQLLPTDTTPAVGLEATRRRAGELVARALPEPQAGLAAAMLIGLRDLVARDVAADFRTTGMSHIVAISGYHIALLAAVAGALLRPLARRPRSLLLVAIVGGYAILAGGSPSVLRAALMAGVVLLARASGRRGEAATGLALAALLLLLIDPATVSDVGFQLSVAATAGLLAWGEPLSGWLRPRLPARLPAWLVEALAVSLAAQLATLPLVLLHFGRLSLVAPLANLLAAPIVAPATAASALALATGALLDAGVPAVLLAPAQLAGALLVGGLVAICRLCAALPLASVELAPPLDLLGAAAAGLLVVWALRRSSRGTGRRSGGDEPQRMVVAARASPARRVPAAAIAALAIALLVAGAVALARPDGRLHMTVLDIGQGDAILLRGPSGSRMLVDTGPDPERLLVELDARIPAWDRRLEMVVITHPHEDHVAGLALLLDRYRIGQIAEPGMIGLGPGDAAFRQRLAELGRTTRILAAGDRFWFDGVEARVHWPLPGRVPLHPSDGGTAVNNVSIVLELRYGERRLLLTGDVEEQIDGQLLAEGIAPPGGPPLDVLKVAHHGSATASTDAFIEALRPQLAVISAGLGNPYGHPSPRTVARLELAGAQLFRTDLDGSVDIATDGHSLTVESSGGRPALAAADRSVARGPGFCPILPPTGAGARRSGTRRHQPYNRRRGRPNARRGLPAAALAGSQATAGRALCRGGRGRRFPCRTH
ncbi:MAG TPA: DNA internalization-related competence protein ComEC/Rec2, partial [Candidatus Limnocylindrales bacterium]